MKRWIAVLLVLACCFMLASCSNRDTGTAVGSDAAASAGGDTAGQMQDDTATEPETEEQPEETAPIWNPVGEELAAEWSGDYFGTFQPMSGTQLGDFQPVAHYTVCARTSVDASGLGTLTVWDPEHSFSDPLMQYQFQLISLEDMLNIRLQSEDGYGFNVVERWFSHDITFWEEGMEEQYPLLKKGASFIYKGNLLDIPEGNIDVDLEYALQNRVDSSELPSLLRMTSPQDFRSITGEGKMLFAFAVRGVFNLTLVPWGDTESWDTLSESHNIGTYPAMYNDWYLPKVQNGESMPDSFS